jgi:hydroxycarboxylate dehydrogenase B
MPRADAARYVTPPPARKQRKAPMTPGSCGIVPDMPTIDASRLERTATRIFERLGAPSGDAAWIAHLLVLANLRGHDSHGVIRIPQYAEAVKAGGINPKSPVRVVAETPVTARLDGGRGFGQVVARRGMELCTAKAKASGLAAVGLSHTTHVGRLADYAEMAAAQGLVGMLWVNAVHGLNVAPWGGAARRLGTNPHAIGIPGAGGPAMVLDFATSVVAEGKMRVKKNRKQQAPPGWFIDAQGRPATDPEIFYGDPVGSLLTAGEHKGYGLSLAVEILGGILSGTGPAGPGPGLFANGTLMICLDVERFVPLPEFHAQVGALFGWVKSAPLAQGSKEILIPGEPEARLESERRRDGVPVEEETWSQIERVAAELGLD